MKNPVVRFVAAVIVLSLLCVLFQVIWNFRTPDKLHLQNGLALLAVFPLITIAVHMFLLNSAKGSPQGFIRSYMAGTFIKFFLYPAVLVCFLLLSEDNKRALVMHFIIYYIAFTVLEVSILYTEMNKKKLEN